MGARGLRFASLILAGLLMASVAEAAPPAPYHVNAARVWGGGAVIQWHHDGGATTFEIERQTNSFTNTWESFGSAPGTARRIEFNATQVPRDMVTGSPFSTPIFALQFRVRAVDGTGSSAWVNDTAPAIPTRGTPKTLILWGFTQTMTVHDTQASAETSAEHVRAYWAEVSHGQLSLDIHETYGPYQVPPPSSASQAIANYQSVANQIGVDTFADVDVVLAYGFTVYTVNVPLTLSNGTTRYVFFPGAIASLTCITCAWSHQVHEAGHSMGLNHAGLWTCSDILPLAYTNCTKLEYGPIDVMGQSSGGYAYSFVHQEKLTWLGPDDVAVGDGLHTLVPLNSTLTGKRAVKYKRPGSDEYIYIEYRQPIGYDFGSDGQPTTDYDGALLWSFPLVPVPGSNSASDTLVLDARPGDAGHALPVGSILIDPAGERIEVVSRTASALTVRIGDPPPPPPSTPAAPTNLTVQYVATNKAKLMWTDNATNETGYAIFRSTSLNGTYSQQISRPADTTQWTQSGLTSGVTYFYKVRAFNAAGNSAYSNTVSITIP